MLPNGDVLIAEATQVAGPIRNVFAYAMQATMRRAAALGESANRITLLRDGNRDGVAETRETFMEGLNQPFGMALVGDTFYVGNTDGVVAFPYTAGADRITAPGRKLTTFKPSGHWTRSLLPSPDGKKLYAGVGSLSNIAEGGMAVEEGRAAIYELDLAAGTSRIFAVGPAQPGGARMGANDRRALDRRQRARRSRRRNPSGLSDLGPRWRLLRLALLLLGADGGRPGAAGCGDGRQGDHAGLCAGRAHRLARSVLAAGRHAAGLSRGHGDRPARLLESQHAERLQGGVRAVRKRPPVGSAAGYFVAASSHRTSGSPTDDRSGVTLGPDGALLVADDVGNVIWRVTGA